MNYSSTHFKKIFLKDSLTSKLDERNDEKKNLEGILPKAWNSPDLTTLNLGLLGIEIH